MSADASAQAKASLAEQGIAFESHSHAAVMTVAEQEAVTGDIKGFHTKNVFIKDKKHGMFLITARHDAQIGNAVLPKMLGLTGKTNLRMCSADVLKEKLAGAQGHLSPLNVMHNKDNDVTFCLDSALLEGEGPVCCHPCFNEETVTLSGADLVKFATAHGHAPKMIECKVITAEEAAGAAAQAAAKAAGGGGGGAAKAPAAPKEKKPKAPKAPKAPKEKGQKKETGLGVSASKDGDFAAWYTETIVRAEMIEYYDISGCYILRPWSYSIWEEIQKFLDGLIKTQGVKNCYFPLFVSKAALTKEEDHLEGFAAEVAWVTHSGDSELEEHIAVRPTSETIMYPAFGKWIRSHRDLPLKLNQWNNVVRWEFKYPTPFLRSREFLWQEGHTAHATKEAADEEVMTILDFYARVYEELLCVPVIKGVKTEKEKFAGGDYTTTVEGFIPNVGRGIQGATSHMLGQNFGKMFKIQFEDLEGNKQIPWQNSWGLTTRVIGVMVMIHGDDKGLVLPPRVSPVQAVLIPLVMGKKGPTQEEMNAGAAPIYEKLKAAGIRVELDDRTNYNPGWKYNHWEQKGVPLRLELGPRDLEKKCVTMVRRDTGVKEEVPISILLEKIEYTLATIQHEMLARATETRDSRLATVRTREEYMENILKGNMCLTPWCNEEEEEEAVKHWSKAEALKGEEEDVRTATSAAAKTLCIPFEQPPLPEGTKCWFSGKPAVNWTLWGRSY
jgi:prolyl-tRNA synthetase